MTVSRLFSRLAAAAAVIALMIAGAPYASAASTSYVALGDSYSSGVGTGTYIADGTSCQRSVYSYPALDAARLGLTLTLRACSGATIADVRASQLSALSAGTGYVTITAGGNDIGWASVITECALPAWMSNCNGAIDSAVAVIRNQLPAALGSLFADIRAHAPNARVVVVGYPRLFNGIDCHLLTFFSSAEMTRLNATADLLDSVTATAAGGAGFRFADPRSAFTGHAVCSSAPWINNLSYPVSESYHPNKAGHVGYAGVVAPVLGVGTAAVPTASQTQVAALVAAGKANASLDARIQPQVVTTPDLTSARARSAAAAAGVDLTSQASITKADRAAEARQVAQRRTMGQTVVTTG